MSWFLNAVRTLGSGFGGTVSHFFGTLLVMLWDTVLVLINLITPKRHFVPDWPEFIPPSATDSRSPCPGLNALSNHGIFPRNGRNIPFKEMAGEVQKHYNCSASFSYSTTSYLAGILRRDYNKDTLDLGDMCVHNGIEHDASMTRHDAFRQPDQSIPDEKLVLDLIAASKDGKKLTPADFSRIRTTRLIHSKETNGQFTLSGFHSFFGAGNAATLLLLLGGEVADIKPFLLEERIPEGWTTRYRSRMGLTMAKFNSTSLKVLLGIDPSWKKVKKIT